MILHVALHFVVAAAVFAVVLRWARHGWALRAGLGVAAVALLIANAVFVDDPRWANVLPVTEVWLWTNLALPGSAALAAVAYRAATVRWQGVLMAGALAAFGSYRACEPMYFPAPQLGPARWDGAGRVCRQSTNATCGPAAVASALAAVGVATEEAPMTRAALTTRSGTSNLGLYRALRVGLAEGGAEGRVRVRAYTGTEAGMTSFPAVVSVEGSGVRQASGLVPLGTRHAVAVLGRTRLGGLLVADPYAGLQRWPPGRLDELRGKGACFLLERRVPGPDAPGAAPAAGG